MVEPIYAIGYARVSTPKQAISGDSWEGQDDDIRAYCKKHGYTLFPNEDKVFMEAFSGKTSSRPEYDEIIKLIKKNPNKVKYFIVRIISRMTRGEIANYYQMKAELKSYGVLLKDVSGIIQEEQNYFDKYGLEYDWSVESPSETSELMEVKKSEIDRKRILRQLIEPQILLTRDGYQIGRADDGYISERVEVDMKKRYVLKPDPERARYFVEMFKLRAEGVYSDKEIVEKINALGYRSKVQKRWDKARVRVVGQTKPVQLTVKALQRTVQRTCYCGVICEKWTNYHPLRAKWDGLVSIETFNKANRGKVYINELPENRLEVLYDQNYTKLLHKRHAYRKDYPFKNIVLCPECRKPLFASGSTGKSGDTFHSYHCSRKHKRYAIPKKDLEKAFSAYLERIRFSDNFVATLEKVCFKKFRAEEGTLADKSNLVSKKVIELKEQKQLKLRAIETTTSLVVKADLEKEYEELHREILFSQNERNRLDVGEDEIHEFIKYARGIMEHPIEMLAEPANKHEQVALYSLFFSEFPTYPEILNGTPKLTLMFKLNQENTDENSQLVSLIEIEPRDSLPRKAI